MATGLGVSPDAVDEMTVERVEELIVYWQDYPPPHLLVRGAVGYKPASRSSGKMTADEVAAFGGKVVNRGR